MRVNARVTAICNEIAFDQSNKIRRVLDKAMWEWLNETDPDDDKTSCFGGLVFRWLCYSAALYYFYR